MSQSSDLNLLDDSEPAIQAMDYLVSLIWSGFFFDMVFFKNYDNHAWYWTEIMKRGLLKYLDLATETTRASSAKSLLYAFTYPGTREGLIQLVHGIFGSHSIVFVEDDENPAMLSLKITNANENSLVVLGKDLETALGTENKKYALAFWDLERIIKHDTRYFIKHFITPGRVLGKITVEVN